MLCMWTYFQILKFDTNILHTRCVKWFLNIKMDIFFIHIPYIIYSDWTYLLKFNSSYQEFFFLNLVGWKPGWYFTKKLALSKIVFKKSFSTENRIWLFSKYSNYSMSKNKQFLVFVVQALCKQLKRSYWNLGPHCLKKEEWQDILIL